MLRLARISGLLAGLVLCCGFKAPDGEVDSSSASAFDVSWNGQRVVCHAAFVSREPFNMVWPGYQRPRTQRRLSHFVSVTLDEKGAGELEVVLPIELAAEKRARVRPLSCRFQQSIAGRRFRAKMPGVGQYVFEFPGIEPELHVFVNPNVPRPAREADLYFGPGEHEAGMIRPKSGQSVYIDEGATVYGFLYLDGVKDVTIAGRGILDSSRIPRTLGDYGVGLNLLAIRDGKGDPTRDVSQLWACSCTNVVIEGIVFRDSPFWTINLRDGCRNILIDNVKIIGQWRYNADGIDICASSDVRVRNSFVRSFDDCVVARGSRSEVSGNITENVLVENCVLWCDWGKNCEVWIGKVPNAIVRNVCFTNNVLANVSSVGCDVTTWRGDLGITVSNVVFSGLECDLVSPRYRQKLQKKDRPDETFTKEPRDDFALMVVDYCPYDSGIGRTAATWPVSVRYEDIRLSNVSILGDAPKKQFILVDEHHPSVEIGRVSIEDVPKSVKTIRKGKAKPAADTVGFASDGVNTVPGVDQIKTGHRVRFEGNPEKGGLLVVGSSYAWHGPNASLDWSGDWGMAATAREKDLAHVLWRGARRIDPDAALCIAQSAYWERNYTGDVELLNREYAEAASFKAKWIVIVSSAANAPKALAAKEPLKAHYEKLLAFFTANNPDAKVVVSVGSSGNAFGKDICEVARRHNYPVVDMNEVLAQPGMRATGLFKHKGVASHPSDLGMSSLAARYALSLGLPTP